MNKYILMIIVLCFYLCCTQKSRYCAVYARNMSTTSGASLLFGPGGAGLWTAEEIYLPARPAEGAPIEKRSAFTYIRGDEMRWEVIKEIGDTLIGSGTFSMEDKWLEVNGTNGDWTCTWSDEEW